MLLILYAILFVLGLVIFIPGRLALSQRRQLVGRNARIAGGAFMAAPVLSMVAGFVGALIVALSGGTDDSARTWGAIAAYVVLSIGVLAIAASLNRLATFVVPKKVDFSGLTARDAKAPDFSMLGGEPPKSDKV